MEDFTVLIFTRKIQEWFIVLIHINPRVLFFWTVIQFLLFGLVLYLFEDAGAKITEPINFWYFWWTTVLTVGYGDLSPGTTLGRLFAPPFMASGIVLLTIWLTKAGMAISNREAKRRNGLMPTRATNHIVVIGDYHHTRTLELLGNLIHDRKNDQSKMPPIVCMFRNTGDENPFTREIAELEGIIPEYHQAPHNGFNPRAFADVNIEQAVQVYVSFEDDMAAIAVVGALSRTGLAKTQSSVAILLRESSNEDLIPNTDLNLQIIRPVQQALAVRELEDPGAGQAVADLIDVRKGSTLFSVVLPYPGLDASYRAVRECFHQVFESRVLPIGFSVKGASGWEASLNPSDDARVKEGNRLLYIAKEDLSDKEASSFSEALGISSRINNKLAA